MPTIKPFVGGRLRVFVGAPLLLAVAAGVDADLVREDMLTT
jgi:hypothetical protein